MHSPVFERSVLMAQHLARWFTAKHSTVFILSLVSDGAIPFTSNYHKAIKPHHRKDFNRNHKHRHNQPPQSEAQPRWPIQPQPQPRTPMPLRRPYNPVLKPSSEGPPETIKEELSSQPPPSRPSSQVPFHHSGPLDTKKEELNSQPLPPSRSSSRAPSHSSGPADSQKQELSFYPPCSQPPSRRPSPIHKEKPSRSVSQQSNASLPPLQPAQPRPSLSSAHSAPSPLATTPATASANNPLLCLVCLSPLPQPQPEPQPQPQPPPDRSSSDSTTLTQQALHVSTPHPHPERAATAPCSPAAAPTTPSSPAPPRWCPSCIRSFHQREASSRRADVLTVFPALVESEGEESERINNLVQGKRKGWVWGRLVLMWGWVVERVWIWGGTGEQRVWVRRGAVVAGSAV